MAHTDDRDSEKTTDCVVCRSEIRAGATKCVHCDSFQGWRRHVVVGDSFLALLVALVSVLSMAAPMLRDTFKTRNSKVTVTFADIQDDSLFLIASNAGSSPGFVSSAQISITGVDASFPLSRTTAAPPFSILHKPIMTPATTVGFIGSVPLAIEGSGSDATFIRPGESKRLRSRLLGDRKIKLPAGSTPTALPPTMRCWLEADVVQFDGKREAQGFVPAANSPAELQLCWLVWRYSLESSSE
jgi:hypothetical protein